MPRIRSLLYHGIWCSSIHFPYSMFITLSIFTRLSLDHFLSECRPFLSSNEKENLSDVMFTLSCELSVNREGGNSLHFQVPLTTATVLIELNPHE